MNIYPAIINMYSDNVLPSQYASGDQNRKE